MNDQTRPRRRPRPLTLEEDSILDPDDDDYDDTVPADLWFRTRLARLLPQQLARFRDRRDPSFGH